uniref:PNT domain-containing protein n=1 Tax=Caenorhabditis tropicalis TaxID=1561998 RepID=A0A1I7TI28_9PELO
MTPTTRSSARSKTEKTLEIQENKAPADRKQKNEETDDLEYLYMPKGLRKKMRPPPNGALIASSDDEPHPKQYCGVYMKTEWKDWTRHDVVQFVRERDSCPKVLNNLWEQKVDGKLIEKIIQFDMETKRRYRFGGKDCLVNPAEEVTPKAQFTISRIFWKWATSSLQEINMSR